MTILSHDLLSAFDASVVDVADAVTMPPAIYTEPEFLDFERKALFAKEWLCVGRASRIPSGQRHGPIQTQEHSRVVRPITSPARSRRLRTGVLQGVSAK